MSKYTQILFSLFVVARNISQYRSKMKFAQQRLLLNFLPNELKYESLLINFLNMSTQSQKIDSLGIIWGVCDNHYNFFRVFNLLADINSGSIIALLLPNVLMAACTMFNFEHVIFILFFNF